MALVAQRIFHWQEILVERNVEFGGQDVVRFERVVVSKFLEDFSRFARGSSHELIKHFEIERPPYLRQMIDVGGQYPVNFCPARSGLGFRHVFAPDMFETIEGLTGHVTLPRLAQRRKRLCLGARRSFKWFHNHLNELDCGSGNAYWKTYEGLASIRSDLFMTARNFLRQEISGGHE